jgi:hypothetical protein
MLGITIDGKHTWNDWGLKWVDYNIGFPPPKISTVDIPGTDGVLDLTDVTGRPRYEMRELEFTFESPDADYYAFEHMKRTVAGFLHGQKRKVTLDTDPNWHYLSRLNLAFEKESKNSSIMILTGTADPYKYKPADTSVSVTASTAGANATLQNAGRWVTPEITVTGAAVQIIFSGTTYSAAVGTQKIPSFILKSGANAITVKGAATSKAVFKYREAIL